MRNYAEELNAILTAGGSVFVSTYTQIKKYTRRNAGDFTQNEKGEVFVRRGKGKDCIRAASQWLVGVKGFGK